jgi:hypothetical protein
MVMNRPSGPCRLSSTTACLATSLHRTGSPLRRLLVKLDSGFGISCRTFTFQAIPCNFNPSTNGVTAPFAASFILSHPFVRTESPETRPSRLLGANRPLAPAPATRSSACPGSPTCGAARTAKRPPMISTLPDCRCQARWRLLYLPTTITGRNSPYVNDLESWSASALPVQYNG